MDDGYYWCWEPKDKTTFIGYLEDGMWFLPGLFSPAEIKPEQVLAKVKRLPISEIMEILSGQGLQTRIRVIS
jgi:hypothetical protein